MSTLSTSKLSLGYDETIVVNEMSVTFPVGRITALVGGNGSGKSTLLKGLARILRPQGGAAYLDGKALHSQSTRRIAREIAILPQGPEAPEGLTVRELVLYGRFPYRRPLAGVGPEDRRAVDRALELTDMASLANRAMDALSGGQRQRAWIAMALAQETPVLLLDEPTTFLDMAHQLEVLHLLESLNRQEGRTIIMVLHDLNQASRFAHHIIGIVDGRIATQGAPDEVMQPETLRRVFGIEADIIADPRSGCRLCIPYLLAGRSDD
ncbi:MAG: ABC transporter ATP-binding protein [Alkalispirochaeta sp.]